MQRFILFLVLVLIYELPVSHGSTQDSYFNTRKKDLKNIKITLHAQPKGSKVDRRYYATFKRNVHDYARLINQPELCSQHEKVFLLFCIRTIYSHHGRRQVLREQFNHQQSVNYGKDLIVKHVFVFAKTDDPITEELIKSESKQYQDIIQEDFVESYTNVSLKAIMAWKWSLEFCPNTEYVMVENDELYVDIDKILSFLLKDLSMGRTDDHFAVCNNMGNSPALHRKMKRFMELPAEVLYQGDIYPPYCNGYGYAAHINVIAQLYQASFSNPSFMPTDVWIGVMAEKLRIKIPELSFLYKITNIETYFADPYYLVNDAMIAVTDIYKNKGKELKIMQNILTSMKRHWANHKYIRNLRGPPIKRNGTQGISVAYCVYIIIFLIVCIIVVCKVCGGRNYYRKISRIK